MFSARSGSLYLSSIPESSNRFSAQRPYPRKRGKVLIQASFIASNKIIAKFFCRAISTFFRTMCIRIASKSTIFNHCDSIFGIKPAKFRFTGLVVFIRFFQPVNFDVDKIGIFTSFSMQRQSLCFSSRFGKNNGCTKFALFSGKPRFHASSPPTFKSWLIAVKQYIVSVTRAARFTVASAWRVKHTSITTHYSTSCIQNSRRQSPQVVPSQRPVAGLSTRHGAMSSTPSS